MEKGNSSEDTTPTIIGEVKLVKILQKVEEVEKIFCRIL